MTLVRFIGFANILEYQVMKINAVFLIEQNIFLLYVIMNFENLNHMHGLNTCFICKIDL